MAIITPTSTITITVDNRTGEVRMHINNEMAYPAIVAALAACLTHATNLVAAAFRQPPPAPPAPGAAKNGS